ncbi:UDP-glucoronosyl and UDP-glucosyl transferase [Ancylostoma caninum]|uniref:UDP-glucuronosyltransferase n=1 Tax=Ancylostoma caninum TaxID=29170 RepID=A0A368FJA5_ANCCA|nr:UDP-glucoronosyl and UDP-glucosyl transferase [Ancylostoma caninum]
MDNVAHIVGVPTFPSYIPPMMMESSDEMDFYQRTKSFIGHTLYNLVWPRMVVNKETQIFREHWDLEFPDIMDLMKKCPLVMVNSNELYELPRPTLAKVVNIGGIGVEYKDAKPLEGEFKKIAETGKGIIVMSFGSVAHAELMPEDWKTAFLRAFAQFPEYEFVIRYASDDLKDRLPPNVHAHRWLPQADLLLHPNTKVFISHGGYNSLQESINSGVPLVTVALFGDQFKNSKIAAKHGFAVNLKKGTLDEASIVAALREVLNNEKYSLNAKRLSLMVRKKPVSPTHLLVKWTEFLAEFQTLDNLTPAGNNLNFFQYFSLDVIGALLLAIFIVVYIVYKLLALIVLRCCCRYKKEKNE